MSVNFLFQISCVVASWSDSVLYTSLDGTQSLVPFPWPKCKLASHPHLCVSVSFHLSSGLDTWTTVLSGSMEQSLLCGAGNCLACQEIIWIRRLIIMFAVSNHYTWNDAPFWDSAVVLKLIRTPVGLLGSKRESRSGGIFMLQCWAIINIGSKYYCSIFVDKTSPSCSSVHI